MMEVDLENSEADPEGNQSVWVSGRVNNLYNALRHAMFSFDKNSK